MYRSKHRKQNKNGVLKKIGFHLLLMGLFLLISYWWVIELDKILFIDAGENVELTTNHVGTSMLFLIFLFFYFLSNRVLVTLLSSNLVIAAFWFANKMKWTSRESIVSFSELRNLFNIKEMLKLIDPKWHIPLLIITIVSVIFLVFLFLIEGKINKKIQINLNNKVRVGLFSILILLFAVIYSQSEIVASTWLGLEYDAQNFNPVRKTREDGLIPTFVRDINAKPFDKPDNYTEKKIFEIGTYYQGLAKTENTKMKNDLRNEHTIIYLSESFWDMPSLLINGPAGPFVNSMVQKNGGHIKSTFIGGGTANIEFSVLTSMSLDMHKEPSVVTPYTDYISQDQQHSSVFSLFDNDQKVAAHPYNFNLYNRRNVYKDFGIDRLIDSKEIPNKYPLENVTKVSDKSFHEYLLSIAKKYSIINALSMQNHSFYLKNAVPDSDFTPEVDTTYLSKGEGKIDDVELVKSYFRQIHESDKAVESLINDLEGENEAINLIFFGDHGPNFLQGKSETIGPDVYLTPYFIYQNKNRTKVNGADTSTKVLSPMFLIPELLEQGEYKRTPFYQLVIELYKANITFVGGNYVIVGQDKIDDNQLNDNMKKLVEDYRLVNYDRYLGNNYLEESFFSEY
ncbi:LTA synthase family protein [Enterococcus massiliensis]|uniref:LTA synthase family protein n=1 Tax=Enterococcus massiliensis TaxID=1640685 RepID=UPI00065E3C0F|nr:LTA synthase family protein [Enterococcus massiliensis]